LSDDRDGLEAFIVALHRIAEAGLKSGHLVEADFNQLDRAAKDLKFFSRPIIEMLDELRQAGRPDAGNALVTCLWGILGSAFTIGHHTAGTESAKIYLAGLNLSTGRQVKQSNDKGRADAERNVLRSFTAGRDIPKPTKFITDNMHILTESARKAGIVPPSKNTWITRMGELGFRSSRESRT
jgi:hypothetical protein